MCVGHDITVKYELQYIRYNLLTYFVLIDD